MRSDGIAFVWPASGVAAGGLLMTAVQWRKTLLGGIFVASVLVNLNAGSSLAVTLWFSLANIVEAYLVCRIASGRDGASGSLNLPRWVARLALGAVAGSIASGTIASLAKIGSGQALEFFLSWTSTVLLGLLVVTPLVLAAGDRKMRRVAQITDGRVLLRSALFLATIAVSVAAFAQQSAPLLYLPLAMAMLMTYFLGPFGAASAVFIAALLGSLFTAKGMGSVHLVEGGPQTRALYFQVYLLVMLASTMPVATLLARSRAAARELRRNNAFLSAAEAKAHVGHWRLQLEPESLYWSDEVFAIHGMEKGRSPDLALALEAYHPADRERVSSSIKGSLASREPFSFEARIQRPDGTIRHVESTGEPELENGEVVAMFGVILDITERWQVLEELRRARNLARKQAREATKLADTDQLTGIASRRKFMERLSEEIARAEEGGGKLSLIMFDVDHFKAFNDSHGHAFGDLVLRMVAREAADSTRGQDLIGRIGGEEFAIIMPGAGMDTGTLAAERIRQRVANLRIEDDSGVAQNVSISLGIGEWTPGADEVWLMQAADNALYEAKRAGRNCLRQAA
ncbi:putative diguanylate cyclase AdrA [Paraurantiacibacter namhicola]|uniref:diguanylate cyclase n=2 Tax=Paraurantiacibacter namhicola TaxID=645517 RepID=A0A1C7DA27_9SPHN|nr:putative diguanylate cyclase AdrA [Paraurantiacibacter namhicola]